MSNFIPRFFLYRNLSLQIDDWKHWIKLINSIFSEIIQASVQHDNEVRFQTFEWKKIKQLGS